MEDQLTIPVPEKVEVKKKELSIETLRGIAIILMVAGHIIGNNAEHGLKVESDSFLRYVYYFFQNIRLPLFTVISGYIYALRPFQPTSSIGGFVKGKFIRLIIPLLVVSTIQYLTQSLTYGVSFDALINGIWKVYFFSYAHFWFLQAIFLIFIIIMVLEMAHMLDSFLRWSIVLLTTSAVFLGTHFEGPTFFSFGSMLYLLPFFILGCGINRFKDKIFDALNNHIVFIILLFVLSFTYQQWVFLTPAENVSRKILMIIIGVSGTLCFFYFRFISAPLGWLGNFAFIIYLYHTIFAAAIRMALFKLNIYHEYIHFPIGLAAGLFFPIFIYHLLSKYPLIRLLLFGETSKQKNQLQRQQETGILIENKAIPKML